MSIRSILPLAAVALLALPAVAVAQSAGSTGMANYQSGYGGSRYTTSQAQTGSTRDANGNIISHHQQHDMEHGASAALPTE